MCACLQLLLYVPFREAVKLQTITIESPDTRAWVMCAHWWWLAAMRRAVLWGNVCIVPHPLYSACTLCNSHEADPAEDLHEQGVWEDSRRDGVVCGGQSGG